MSSKLEMLLEAAIKMERDPLLVIIQVTEEITPQSLHLESGI